MAEWARRENADVSSARTRRVDGTVSPLADGQFFRSHGTRGWSVVKAEGMLSAWLLGHGLIAPFVSPDHYVLTLDQLIAFAIVDDHERQEAAFERLAPNHEPYMIRRVLLNKSPGPRPAGALRRIGGL